MLDDLVNPMEKISAIRGNNDTSGESRKALAQVLRETAESMVQGFSQQLGDHFIFSGNDGLNAPFEWKGEDLYYRGINVKAGQVCKPTAPEPNWLNEVRGVNQGAGTWTDNDEAWYNYYTHQTDKKPETQEPSWLNDYATSAGSEGGATITDLEAGWIKYYRHESKDKPTAEEPAWAASGTPPTDKYGVPTDMPLVGATEMDSAWIAYYKDQGDLAKLKEMSEEENRMLAGMPRLSWSSLVSGDFMTKYETYLADQFPGRDGWMGMKTRYEALLGKREFHGVYLCGDRLISKLEDAGRAESNMDYLRRLGEKAETPVYLGLIPTAAEIWRDRLPEGAESFDQGAYLERVRAACPGLEWVDIGGALAEHAGEEIYYRTDHHWTSLGAYYGYTALIRALGMEPVEPGLMDRAPKPREEGIFARGLGLRVALQGAMFAALSLVSFWLGLQRGGLAPGRTMAFITLAVSQLVQAYNMRSHRSLFQMRAFGNRTLNLACGASLLLMLVVVFTPLRIPFGLAVLPPSGYFTAFGLCLVPLVVMEAAKAAGMVKA